MEEIIIALGSNLGDRLENMRDAKSHLQTLSGRPITASSLYETEPVGPSMYDFLNAVVRLHSSTPPLDLLTSLKEFETSKGREINPPKWTARILDMDIIAYGKRRLITPELTLPHPEYHKRKFVLVPLAEIYPDWTDPVNGSHIQTMIEKAENIDIFRTSLNW